MKKILLGFAAVAAAMFAIVGTASASGGTGAYKVGFAFNCDNRLSPFCAPAPAGFSLGGEWGSYTFNSNGTYEAQLTFCGHGQGFDGATHQSENGTWWIGAAGFPLFGESFDFFVSDPSVDGGAPQDTMIPAVAGHYSTKLAPAVSAEAEVSAG